MATPLQVALAIGQIVRRAQMHHNPLNRAECAADIFLRYVMSGCSRQQIADALEAEAMDAGVPLD